MNVLESKFVHVCTCLTHELSQNLKAQLYPSGRLQSAVKFHAVSEDDCLVHSHAEAQPMERDSGTTAIAPSGSAPLSGPTSGGPSAVSAPGKSCPNYCLRKYAGQCHCCCMLLPIHRLLDQHQTSHAGCFAWTLSQMGCVITVIMACSVFRGIITYPISNSIHPLCIRMLFLTAIASRKVDSGLWTLVSTIAVLSKTMLLSLPHRAEQHMRQ